MRPVVVWHRLVRLRVFLEAELPSNRPPLRTIAPFRHSIALFLLCFPTVLLHLSEFMIMRSFDSCLSAQFEPNILLGYNTSNGLATSQCQSGAKCCHHCANSK